MFWQAIARPRLVQRHVEQMQHGLAAERQSLAGRSVQRYDAPQLMRLAFDDQGKL